MKAAEMAEFKHPSVRLEKEDWGCLHCWTGNSTQYTSATWASVKTHLKEKYAKHVPSMFVWTLPPNAWICRHDVEKPTEDDYYCERPTLQCDYFLREAATM